MQKKVATLTVTTLFTASPYNRNYQGCHTILYCLRVEAGSTRSYPLTSHQTTAAGTHTPRLPRCRKTTTDNLSILHCGTFPLSAMPQVKKEEHGSVTADGDSTLIHMSTCDVTTPTNDAEPDERPVRANLGIEIPLEGVCRTGTQNHRWVPPEMLCSSLGQAETGCRGH